MSTVKIFFLLVTFLISGYNYAQTSPFEISINPINIDNLGGVQSYAFGQHEGKWLIVGGRLDGLHRRQPFAAFNVAGNNIQLIVVDPVAQQKWSAPLSSLPASIQEQLSSTNMQFYQEGEYLYCVGGYGYSAIEADHTTYPNLTAIKVPDVINAVMNNSSLTAFFRQITDSEFQVTGGRLSKMGTTYYLLGGHKFIGRYNPMGPNNGPGFIQEYTDAIRKFELQDDGTTMTVTHLAPHTDAVNLHRRDYNAEPQIMPDGSYGITMFSGVFQHNADLPFLNSVTVNNNGYTVNNTFQQYYNHYHCPVIPIYSETNNEMHNVFFGGIAQFYDNLGTLVQDDNVPFVNTIARVTRNASGDMAEYKLPIVMPALLGSGAEFIPNYNLPHFDNGVFKLDNISTDSVLIGYIYGGISSTQPNIFFTNDGTQSTATSQIFEVFIKKPDPLSVDNLNSASVSLLNLMIYPNPNAGELNISFNLTKNEDVKITILDVNGALVDEVFLRNLQSGKNHYSKNMSTLTDGNIYFISLETSTEQTTHKLIIAK